jgi:galactosyl transferase GMA12/MNN10 family
MNRVCNIVLWLTVTLIFHGCLAKSSHSKRSEALSKRPRIAIVTLYDEGYQPIGKYSDPNKIAYAKKHGYDIILGHTTLDNSRPTPWSKIVALEKYLDKYDWLFWTDADSLIMNQEILLETLIDDDFDLIISKETTLGNINTGNFLIKNSRWSKKLLKNIYAQTEFINAPCWEQDTLAYLLKIKPSLYKHIKLIDQRLINAHPYEPGGEYETGQFIIHFYSNWGITPKTKGGLMATYSQLVKY